VLQTLAPNETYRSGEPTFGADESQGLNLSDYVDVLRRKIFHFLIPFGVISAAGLCVAGIMKPSYLSEGKILAETQRISPDLVRPIVTGTASERIQLVQQRIFTRDNLTLIARKFGLFPHRSGVFDLMRESSQVKLIDIDGQPRQGTTAIAFTVGFEYEDPELAMKVANEFVTLIVNEDARSLNSRATETVRLLTSQAKDIEDKIEAAQSQMLEIARRPRESVPEVPEREKSQLTLLASLKAELIQKTSIYSDSHPAVIALRKRIAAMEKAITQSPPLSEKAQSTQADDMEALRRQREALEKQLADANAKLASARLREKLDRDQQSEQLQVIERPALPLKPLKSNKLKVIAAAFAFAVALGIGAALVSEFLDGSIRSRHQLFGVVDSQLVVAIPYVSTHADVVSARWRKILIGLTLVTILATLSGLAAVIVFHVPLDFFWSGAEGWH
jgi:uncharacterized protein involved in exopolysaccharide biosynthesis